MSSPVQCSKFVRSFIRSTLHSSPPLHSQAIASGHLCPYLPHHMPLPIPNLTPDKSFFHLIRTFIPLLQNCWLLQMCRRWLRFLKWVSHKHLSTCKDAQAQPAPVRGTHICTVSAHNVLQGHHAPLAQRECNALSGPAYSRPAARHIHVTDAAEDTYYTVMTTIVSGN